LKKRSLDLNNSDVIKGLVLDHYIYWEVIGIRVLVREPLNQPLHLREIEGTLEDFQELVGEFIEIVQITTDIVCICNEKGSLQGLGNNFHCDGLGWIVGTCIFTSTKDTEFTSLSDKQIGYISEYIGFPVV